MNEQVIIDCAIRCEDAMKRAHVSAGGEREYQLRRAQYFSELAFAEVPTCRRVFCVIGQCLNARGQWTSFVLNNVPATSARGAAHAAVADMERRGASNVQPHKVTETTP